MPSVKEVKVVMSINSHLISGLEKALARADRVIHSVRSRQVRRVSWRDHRYSGSRSIYRPLKPLRLQRSIIDR